MTIMQATMMISAAGGRGVLVSDSTTTTLTGTTQVNINWDTEDLDEGGYFTAPSTDLIVPANSAGWYFATMNVTINAATPARFSAVGIIPGTGTTWTTNYQQELMRTSNNTFNHARSLAHLVKLPVGACVMGYGFSLTTTKTLAAGGMLRLARVFNTGSAAGAFTYRNSAQTITSATPTAISFNTEALDEGGMIDIGSQPTRVTIQDTGWYLTVMQSDWASTSTFSERRSIIRKNGSGPWVAKNVFVAGEAGGDVELPACGIAYLTASDYLEAIVYQSQVGSVTLDTGFLVAVKVDTADTIGAHVSHAGSAQSITTGADRLITFDTEDQDDDGMVDLGSQPGRITATEDGLYAIAGHVGLAGGTTVFDLKIKVDGSTTIAHQSSEPFAFILNVTAIAHLTAGQYVSLYASSGSNTTTTTGDDRSQLGMVLLSLDT